MLEHHEPILLVGIPESKLDDFSAQYVDKSVRDRIRVGSGQLPGYVNVDAIAGATVTVVVLNDAVMRSAQRVAISRGLIEKPRNVRHQPARIRADVFQQRSWSELLGDGSIRSRLISRGEVDDAFKGTPAEPVDKASTEQRGELFAELYYTLLDPPTVGRNLLGEEQYRWLMEQLKPGEHAVAVLGNGYSFKGSGYVRGGIFDRLQLQQENRPISFRDSDYVQLSDLGLKDVPHFREMAIFIVRAENAFDPGQPWQLELLVRRQTGPLDSLFSLFSADYRSPEAYLEHPPEAAAQEVAADDDAPLWLGMWQDRTWRIGILAAGLLTLVVILLVQDVLVRRPRFLKWLHRAFQVYTVVFLGWYALAQLSVVNVLTLVNSLIQGFRWETFLMEPLLFILWSFVAVSLLLWGRGVYCGWLCPFGALQELLNDLAVKLGVPQWRLPFAVNQRLWTLKYLILFGLFGISLYSLDEAKQLAEVEPFKTVFLLTFLRDWGYVLYAALLLLVSLFSRKWYCRYVCPLGAALVIPGRLRLFDWLKRRQECGQPCRLCANECEVQAIHPDGRIDGNECHYCLDCQVTYHDQQRCPPLVARQRRRKNSRSEEAQAELIDVKEV
ncbi:ferredoxin-type protein, NapH/MauN family [compost metagenome]